MKTDLQTIKNIKVELARLTDAAFLQKEMKRLKEEIKKIEAQILANPRAREQVNRLEKRFRELMKTLTRFQSQMDTSFTKFIKVLRSRKPHNVKTSTAKKATRNTSKKATRKSANA